MPTPLRPRPTLTIVLGVVLILWLILLVVLRLTTVHHPSGTEAETPAAPSLR